MMTLWWSMFKLDYPKMRGLKPDANKWYDHAKDRRTKAQWCPMFISCCCLGWFPSKRTFLAFMAPFWWTVIRSSVGYTCISTHFFSFSHNLDSWIYSTISTLVTPGVEADASIEVSILDNFPRGGRYPKHGSDVGVEFRFESIRRLFFEELLALKRWRPGNWSC